MKPRQTAENTPSSMVVENPWVIGPKGGMQRTGYNRHMKHGQSCVRLWQLVHVVGLSADEASGLVFVCQLAEVSSPCSVN